MTYKEWFTETCNPFGLTEAQVELIICNSIGADKENETVEVIVAKKALCAEFSVMIPAANISEGGYSLSWNLDAVKLWYNTMCAQLGITNCAKPRVKGRSDIW